MIQSLEPYLCKWDTGVVWIRIHCILFVLVLKLTLFVILLLYPQEMVGS
jgi:hypothetical protein